MKIVELLMRESLPQKNFFRVFEVCSLLKVEPHEIRHWETEFPQVRSQKTSDGQRIYSREAVVVLSLIKQLLHEKDFTLAGAQRVIAQSVGLSSIWEREEAPCAQPQEVDTSLHAQAQAQAHANDETHEGGNELVLEEASRMLDDDDEFDEVAHQIYQQCGEELEKATMDVPAFHVGEMIRDAMTQKDLREKQAKKLSKLEYEQALQKLTESKRSLTDLLSMLDSNNESAFGRKFSH